MDIFWKFLNYCKEKNITTILDLDDNWEVGPQHPLYATNKSLMVPEKIVENIKRFDYVTTTTPIFAEKIKKYNQNVFVFENSIDPTDEQYQPIKNESKRIRFGFVMGSAHMKDLEQFSGVINSLGKDVQEKIQIVLCGFDLRGAVSILNNNNQIIGKRPIKPSESVWASYEKVCTDNYKSCSPEYKDFLLHYIKDVQWPKIEEEPYRREWTKNVSEYAKHYRNIDVLFAPLDCNGFNEVKSELKLIEGGFTRTAVICTNFGPYTIGTESLLNFGGEINKNGNCILIDPAKKHKDWAKAIKKIVEHPEYIQILTDNLYNTVKDKYDIRNVTQRRAEWYRKIRKNKE